MFLFAPPPLIFIYFSSQQLFMSLCLYSYQFPPFYFINMFCQYNIFYFILPESFVVKRLAQNPSRACALFPHSHKASGSCPNSHVCSVFVWLLYLFRFCLSEFIFQLPIPGICLLDNFFVLFALCSLNLFSLVFFLSSHSV